MLLVIDSSVLRLTYIFDFACFTFELKRMTLDVSAGVKECSENSAESVTTCRAECLFRPEASKAANEGIELLTYLH